MRRRIVLLPMLLAISCFGYPTDLASQSGAVPTFSSGRLWRFSDLAGAQGATLTTGIFGDGSKDYRYAGFWVGAATGAGMAYLAHEFCVGSDGGCQASLGRELLGTTLVIGIMGTVGALIGAQFGRGPS